MSERTKPAWQPTDPNRIEFDLHKVGFTLEMDDATRAELEKMAAQNAQPKRQRYFR